MTSSQAQPGEDGRNKSVVAIGRRQRRNGNTSPAKVRAELNLEKWPAIWQPSKSRNQKALRVFEREVLGSFARAAP